MVKDVAYAAYAMRRHFATAPAAIVEYIERHVTVTETSISEMKIERSKLVL
jgi:hypothetical protein